MTPVHYIPIQGTHGWDEDENNFKWWEAYSAFSQYLKSLNAVQIDMIPFEWSTELDGIWTKHLAWKGAGKALTYYIGYQFPQGLPYEKRNLIAHSHGGQAVFYACSYGLRIRNLITIGTPVRADMEGVVLAARKNIGYWLHIYDNRRDFLSIFGALFDGAIRVKHDFSLANKNDNASIFKIRHSDILTDPSKFGLWHTRDWAKVLSRAAD